MSSFSHRQRILSVFRGETVDQMPWVPRIDLWLNAQLARGTVPERFEGMTVEDIHRSRGWPLHKMVPEFSRPEKPEDQTHFGIGLFDLKEYPCTFQFSPDVDIRVRHEVSEAEQMTHVEYHTPVGMVSVAHGSTREMKKGGASIGWTKEHAIKGPEDYRVMAHIFGGLKILPAYERFQKWRASVGEDGVAVATGLGLSCGSPMHFLQKQLIDPTDFYLHFKDHPAEIAMLIEALEGVYEQLIEVLSGAEMDALLWVSNVDDMLTYPKLYQEHFQPWCRRASEILKPKGVVMICHPDGENQGLMDLLIDSGMDVADAVTPWPMTKVRLEEYYDRWCRPGHMTIHGGIPETLLLEKSSTMDDLKSFMDHFFKAVAPGDHFVASIGDTTPPDADFDRLDYIGERIAEEGALPLAAGSFQPLTEASLAKAAATAPPTEAARERAAEPDEAHDEAFDQITDDVLDGDEKAVVVHAQEMLDRGYSAGDILNKGMLPAMDIISEEFTDGTVFIPEVLLSARAMNDGVKMLEPHMAQRNARAGGRVLIGTVLGDLHDIGKNMVVSMLKGSGFEVNDAGVNISVEEFVDMVREHRPHVLGMSALLTTTMPQMKSVIDALEEAGLRDDVKIIVGGAPVNQAFADSIGADGYAGDAGQAVALAREQLPEELGAA